MVMYIQSRGTVLSTVLLALCPSRGFAQPQGESYRLYGDFAPLEFPNTNGCPLAGIWSLGSQYPLNNVQGPLTGVNDVTFSPPSTCNKAEFDAIAAQAIKDYDDGVADAAGNNRNLFHAAATYSAVAGPGSLGGTNGGWMRFKQNLDFPENAGLDTTVAYIEDIVKKYPCITFADATTFVGAVLTEAAGGPAVAWMPGRSDANKTPENPLIAARLPDGTFTSSGVVYYYTQLGLTDRELAILNGGGHSIGGAGASASGWNGTFTPYGGASFPTPKNLYFVQTFENQWIPQVTKKSDGKLRLQYVLVGDDNEPILSDRGAYIIRIPSDVAILLDGREPTAWAYSYSKDVDLFMADYGRVLQRISQLGAGTDWKLNQTQYEWLGINGNATNYGVDMEPQGGDSPVPLDAIVFPKWVEELRQTPGPTFVLTKEDSNAVANAGSNAGATGGTQTSSSAGPALLHGLMTIGVFCFMWYV